MAHRPPGPPGAHPDLTAGRFAGMEELPPGYPSGFETDVVLADGATAHVRPIRPEDGPLLGHRAVR